MLSRPCLRARGCDAVPPNQLTHLTSLCLALLVLWCCAVSCHAVLLCRASSCSEKEIKQLQGWKATVENLMERFEDLIRQTQMLSEIQDPSGSSRLAGVDEAAAAEEGLGPMAAGVARSTILTATHTVQLNKLRCGECWMCSLVGGRQPG